MWDRYRLFFEKKSLGSSTSWVDLVNTGSINSMEEAIGLSLEYWGRAQFYLPTNRLPVARVFHFLRVVDW
jgi:hypothetical protein